MDQAAQYAAMYGGYGGYDAQTQMAMQQQQVQQQQYAMGQVQQQYAMGQVDMTAHAAAGVDLYQQQQQHQQHQQQQEAWNAQAAAPQAEVPAIAAAPAEPAKETEEDAPEDARPRISERVTCPPHDMSLNVAPSVHGNVLMTLTDGGLQYFLAGARANVGLKSGRYMFEAKIVEILNPAEMARGRVPQTTPRQLLRIGLSTANSSLFLGESEESVCFDSEGNYTHDKKSTPVSPKFARDQSIAIVVNLDEKSPNAYTVSLFRDGVRVTPPQPLPEALKGKTLFPTITFKNLTVHLNFGPTALAALPFTCRTVQDAAADDVQVVPAAPKDKPHEVLFPVALPDEGTFDWLDGFLQQNPQYTEISERMILDWSERSGLQRNRGFQWRASNDRVDMSFGVPQLDDGSLHRMLGSIAPAQSRGFVVMEVKSNLVKAERAELVKRFAAPHFKRVALVLLGEPTEDFKQKVHSHLLALKQEESDTAFRVRKQQEKEQKLAELRLKQQGIEQRRMERAARKAQRAAERAAKLAAWEAQKRMAEERRQQEEAHAAALAAIASAEKAAAGEAEGEQKDGEKKEGEGDAAMPDAEKKEETAATEAKPEEPKQEEVKEPELGEEEPDEPDEEDVKMEVEDDEQPPKVVLSAEELKQRFRKMPFPDLAPGVMASSFAAYELPSKEEGFDEIRFLWSKEAEAASYLKAWVLERKLTTRMEDLQPGEWFNEQWTALQQQLLKWRTKQSEWKDPARRAALPQPTEAAEGEQRDAAMEEKPAEANAQEGAEGAEPKPAAEAETKVQEPASMEVSEEVDELDVFGVADVMDIGKGEPLFANFAFEDWTLFSLRAELHLLAHGYRKDVVDLERLGIHVDNLLFYYNKYFRKTFNTKAYGVETIQELVALVDDTVLVNPKNQVLEAQLSDELDNFDLLLKLTEECRRERNLLLDSGDESVALKINQALLTAPAAPAVGVVGAVGAVSAAAAQPGAAYGAMAAAPQQGQYQRSGPYNRGPRPQGDRWQGGGYGGGGYGKGGYGKGGGYGGGNYGACGAGAAGYGACGGGYGAAYGACGGYAAQQGSYGQQGGQYPRRY